MRMVCLLLGIGVATGACSSPEATPPAALLTRIVISGATSPIILGSRATIQLSAQGTDQLNRPIAATFAWASSDPTLASIDQAGLVTLVATGSVTISAASQGVTGTTVIAIVPPPPAPAVGRITLDDVTNHGTAADFEVAFAKVADESRVREYRVIMVKASSTSPLSLTAVSALPASRYTLVAKANRDVKVALSAATLDVDGQPIGEDIPYFALALSVADGVNAKEHSLSAPSNTMRAGQTTVKLTFVADDGVLVSDGTKAVAIDALPPTSTVLVNQQTISWIPAAPGLLDAIQNATPPYDGIAAYLVTHDHPDHWAQASTVSFLASHPLAVLAGPQQVVSRLAGHPRVSGLSPGLYQSGETTVDGIRIRAYGMLHFNNFGVDFSSVQNVAYLVELGGRKVLHLGDADYTRENFATFDLLGERIDVVIVPAAAAKVTAANIQLVRSLIAPRLIVAAHLETAMSERQLKDAWGDDVVVFTQSLQFVRY